MMSSCHSPTDVHDLVYQQRVLQEQDRNRLAQIMHTAVNTMGLRDVRPTQDEDAMFPTPGNSPPYTANDGGACYHVQGDMGCHYSNTLTTQPSINGIEMQAVPITSATPYVNAPGSPVDDTYYHGHSPYSSPYEKASSPQSSACSPHSTVSCNMETNYEQFIPSQPAADPLTTMATTGVSLPPITSIPITTATCTSLEYHPEMENHKCIYTMAPPLHIGQQVFYPPASQTGEWTSHQPPRFTEPNFVPPHSAAMIGTSVAEGELPINVIINEQQFPDTDSISYYPLTPESPEDRQTTYICQDFPALPKDAIFLPPGASQMTICPPPFAHGPVKAPSSTRAQKRKRPEKPAVQVDDSEIKDIPTSAQLWEFTLRVLKKPKYHYMVNWENKKEGLFRFHDAQAFAALWGKHRNRPNMTYDKVARALRYYYKRDILNQVGGRLTYRFSKRLSKLYMTDE